MIRIRLNDILIKQGVSQRALGRMTGIRPPTIGDLCKNPVRDFIYIYHLDAISRALDITPCDLLDYDIKEPHPHRYADSNPSFKKKEGGDSEQE